MPIFAMFFNIQLRVDEKRINTKNMNVKRIIIGAFAPNSKIVEKQ